MSNINIRKLVDPNSGEQFYPQTDINGLVNNGGSGVDDEPVAGSRNLVESGGVAKQIYLIETIAKSSELAGYITSNGNISSSQMFIVYQYQVTAGNRIKVTNLNHVGSSIMYAFYSSSEFSSSTLVGEVGPIVSQSEDSYNLTVPEGATYLGITWYNNEVKAEKYTEKSLNYLNEKVERQAAEIKQIEILVSTLYSYKRVGEDFYAAYLDNGIEMCYWFRKCMANQLYTFYRVGYRLTDRTRSSAENINNDNSIIWINKTGSDNIGPTNYISTAGQGGSSFVGGNHHYPSESANPRYNTALNLSFHIYADNKEVLDNVLGFATNLTIKVENVVFDPGFPPSEGDTSLSIPLYYEYVTYVINKNNIEVGCKHKYVSGASGRIAVYYGMQSMFADEDYYITPNGLRTTWKEAGADSDSFSKEDYPNFNRFIEKNSTIGYYQSTYLLTDFSLGKHNKIQNSSNIFQRGNTGKDYHHLVDTYQISGETVLQWNGTYTFFKESIVDDDYLLVYLGSARGKDRLFINTKQAFSGNIPVPANLMLKKMSIIENYGFVNEDDATDFNIGGEGIYISGQSTGSMIIEFDEFDEFAAADVNIMIASRDWKVSGGVIYDTNEIPVSYNIAWSDGTSGTVVMSNFNDDVFEYTTITAAYKTKTIVYTLTYDSNGYITNETYTIN